MFYPSCVGPVKETSCCEQHTDEAESIIHCVPGSGAHCVHQIQLMRKNVSNKAVFYSLSSCITEDVLCDYCELLVRVSPLELWDGCVGSMTPAGSLHSAQV